MLYIDWITWKEVTWSLGDKLSGSSRPWSFSEVLSLPADCFPRTGDSRLLLGKDVMPLCNLRWRLSGSYIDLAVLCFCLSPFFSLFFFFPFIIGGSHDKKWNLSSGQCIYWARTSVFGPVLQQFHWWIYCSMDSIGKHFVLYFSFKAYLKEWIENCPCHSALPFLTCSDFSCHCRGSARILCKHVVWEPTGFLSLEQRCESKFTDLSCNYALVQVICLKLFC